MRVFLVGLNKFDLTAWALAKECLLFLSRARDCSGVDYSEWPRGKEEKTCILEDLSRQHSWRRLSTRMAKEISWLRSEAYVELLFKYTFHLENSTGTTVTIITFQCGNKGLTEEKGRDLGGLPLCLLGSFLWPDHIVKPRLQGRI